MAGELLLGVLPGPVRHLVFHGKDGQLPVERARQAGTRMPAGADGNFLHSQCIGYSPGYMNPSHGRADRPRAAAGPAERRRGLPGHEVHGHHGARHRAGGDHRSDAGAHPRPLRRGRAGERRDLPPPRGCAERRRARGGHDTAARQNRKYFTLFPEQLAERIASSREGDRRRPVRKRGDRPHRRGALPVPPRRHDPRLAGLPLAESLPRGAGGLLRDLPGPHAPVA